MSTARLLAACASFLLLVSSTARAEPQNHYADRGRTIVSGSVSGYRSNASAADPFDHTQSWAGQGALTMLHFVANYFAIGGSLDAGARHLEESRRTRPGYLYAGGDLDLVGQLPMSRRLSLRLWLWGGVHWSRVSEAQPRYEGAPDVDALAHDRITVTAGASPELLVHLTSSVALTFGPAITLTYDLDEDSVELGYRSGPGMTYAFGPDEAGRRFEDARRFSERGRRVLSSWFSYDSEAIVASFGFARFVIPRLALGGYLSGGTDGSGSPIRNWFGGGAQVMYDLPLAGSTSLLAAPSVGYMWKRPLVGPNELQQIAHELQVRVPVYATVHLHEGLVIGAGPELALDLRLSEWSASEAPNAQYVRGGVSSTLSASF